MKTKICNKCREEKELTSEFWPKRNSSRDGFHTYCKTCINKMARKLHKIRKINGSSRYIDKAQSGCKTCRRCGEEKELTKEFWIVKNENKDGFNSHCKACTAISDKKHREENKEKISKTKKEKYRKDKERGSDTYLRHREATKKYRKENKDAIANNYKRYRKAMALYSTYKDKLFADETREKDGDFLEVRCKHCKGWHTPTNQQVQGRIRGMNEYGKGESHFYCSQKCKDNCEVYGKVPEYLEKQDELNAGHYTIHKHEGFYTDSQLNTWSQQVRDNADNKCEICGQKGDLQAHHINPKSEYPEQALDPLNGICLCDKCHYGKGHSQDGCKTGQLRKCNIK